MLYFLSSKNTPQLRDVCLTIRFDNHSYFLSLVHSQKPAIQGMKESIESLQRFHFSTSFNDGPPFSFKEHTTRVIISTGQGMWKCRVFFLLFGYSYYKNPSGKCMCTTSHIRLWPIWRYPKWALEYYKGGTEDSRQLSFEAMWKPKGIQQPIHQPVFPPKQICLCQISNSY